jgi:hypothetical protein
MLLSAAFLSVFTLTVVFYVAKWIKLHAKVLMATAKIPGPPRTGFLIGNLTYLQNSPGKESEVKATDSIVLCRKGIQAVAGSYTPLLSHL